MPQPAETIAIVGLGYVGLPLAHAFGKAFPSVIGFDVNPRRIEELRRAYDRTGELDAEAFGDSAIRFTGDAADLKAATVFIVTVPTPIDESRNPDLTPILGACDTVGAAMRKGAAVVFESTFYPGLTESVCVPRLEERSGLVWKRDFAVGYSPERINPGDREHRIDSIVKVVAGDGPETLDRIAALYERIVPAGIHRAPSIAVAEAAKVIENTQRDVNIALMNELAIIFDRLGLRTADVLAAAGTKWNFLHFTPGLVGGHCIGVDPYYLTARAEQVGYQPHVILSGRRVNDGMGGYIADKLIQLVLRTCGYGRAPRVGILGVTFKENVPDIRNSRVPDIVTRLGDYHATCLVHDPLADRAETEHEYGLALVDLTAFTDLDALVLAVPHRAYLEAGIGRFMTMLRPSAVLIDVKSALDPTILRDGVAYWSL
jgi:UDP-N-acetyl-D-galactosamine dehydrogenase